MKCVKDDIVRILANTATENHAHRKHKIDIVTTAALMGMKIYRQQQSIQSLINRI